jgi:ABC-type uncharacterized transport system fused permease/ATPase subunit
VISIAHRPTVAAFHQRRLQLEPDRQVVIASPIAG